MVPSREAQQFDRNHLSRLGRQQGELHRLSGPLLWHRFQRAHFRFPRSRRQRWSHDDPRPVFLIHGDEDHMIAPANMDCLFECARPPRQKWLGPGPHSNVLAVDYDEYQRRVVSFFKIALTGNAMTSNGSPTKPLAPSAP